VQHKYPALEFARYTGLGFGEPMQLSQLYNTDTAYSYDSLLVAMSSIFRLSVDDSLRLDIRPRFHYHAARKQPGLLYMIPAHDLPIGEHYVQVQTQYLQEDSLEWYRGGRVYFYR
jgi:hypothetical protein